MKKRWFQGGRRIIQNGKQVLCNDCPCYGDEIIISDWSTIRTAKLPVPGNAINWKVRHTFTYSTEINYNGEYFLAVKTAYPYRIYKSTDLSNWTLISEVNMGSATSRPLTWCAGRWLKEVNTGGSWMHVHTLTSIDGVNWDLSEEITSVSSVNDPNYTQDASGNLYYIIFTDKPGQSYVGYKTSDFVHWEDLNCTISNVPQTPYFDNGYIVFMRKVIRANDKYYGLGLYRGVYNDDPIYISFLAESSDLVHWSDLQAFPVSTYDRIQGLAYNGYLFIAAMGGVLYSSPDMVNWVPRYRYGFSNYEVPFFEWSDNASMFVIAINGSIISSYDGISWKSVGTGLNLYNVMLRNTSYSLPPIGGNND